MTDDGDGVLRTDRCDFLKDGVPYAGFNLFDLFDCFFLVKPPDKEIDIT